MGQKNQHSYTEQQKINYVREFLKSSLSKLAFSRDKKIDRGALARWIDEYEHLAELEEGHLHLGHFVDKTTVQYDEHGKVSRRWLKTSSKTNDLRQSVIKAIEQAKTEIHQYPPLVEPKGYEKGLCHVFPVADAHVGSFASNNGKVTWDLEIAKKYLCTGFDYLNSVSEPCEKVYIINLGDYFHYNKLSAQTEMSGHIIDSDGSPHSMLDVGVFIMTYMIRQALKKHKEVVVDNISGNHDGLMSYALSLIISHAFANDPRVTVILDHNERHYHRFGKVFIGAVHGHRTKDAQLPTLMATERPKDWGDTECRVWYRGHHHKKKSEEFNGCYVEQVRTAAPGGRYADDHGFLSVNELKRDTYHMEDGYQGMRAVGIKKLRRLL